MSNCWNGVVSICSSAGGRDPDAGAVDTVTTLPGRGRRNEDGIKSSRATIGFGGPLSCPFLALQSHRPGVLSPLKHITIPFPSLLPSSRRRRFFLLVKWMNLAISLSLTRVQHDQELESYPEFDSRTSCATAAYRSIWEIG
ncbi:hypothetical protein KSP40_PGU000793 [Platanthera guangdongensis]|uniref:Uncharacterized protein n=1 Tax=Platanthera guangdongensis TaxID=2320717 RepID=A0ABR2MJ45_9ASPA